MEESDVIILDEEACPFTIVTVKIGDNGTVEETNEPIINLDPEVYPTTNEKVDDSSETDNSDDWTDEEEPPANDVSAEPKTKRKRKKGPIVCPYCGKLFGQKFHLRDHIMTHTGERPFKCIVCNKGFIQRSNLNRHISQHHPSEAPFLLTDKASQSFHCWDCKRSFNTHIYYAKHMELHLNVEGEKHSSSVRVGETSSLDLCSDSDALSDGAEISYSCAFCNQEYPNEDSLASHMDDHTAGQSSETLLCAEERTEGHTEHQRKGETEYSPQSLESFSCKYCGLSWKSRVSLSYHERTHRIKRRLHTEPQRKGEAEYSSPQSPESFRCKYCGILWNSRVSLSYHERTHRIQRQFRCSVCRRGFDKRQAYERHLRKHSAQSGLQRTETHSNQQITERFDCKYCGKTFETNLSLSYHERTHRIQRKFHCSVCNKGFNKRHVFERHIKLHSTAPSLCCKLCGKQCTSALNLSYHERSHKTQRKFVFVCSVCQRGFNSRQAHDQHVTKHWAAAEPPQGSAQHKHVEDNPTAFRCQYCGKEFNSKVSLSYHERTHSIARTFRCTFCQRGFDSEKAYDRHIRTHLTKRAEPPTNQSKDGSGHEAFICKYCGKVCNTTQTLSYHERTHKIKRTFSCSVCSRGFNNRLKYERHVEEHQRQRGEGGFFKPGAKPFSCKDCAATFSSELSLAEHEAAHRAPMAFRCSVCNKGFNRRQTYERHMKLHSARAAVHADHRPEEDSVHHRALTCGYCGCGKQFDTKLKLSYHERTHRIKRTFHCSVCNRGFDRRQAYLRHIRTHSPGPAEPQKDEVHDGSEGAETPFSCDLCGARFKSRPSLVAHVEKHKSSTSYCCRFCDKGFTTKSSCVMHEKSHTVGMPYSCIICSEKFKIPGRLELHMKTHAVTDTDRQDLESVKPSHQETPLQTENPLCCFICHEEFNDRQAHELHVSLHCLDPHELKAEVHKEDEPAGDEPAGDEPAGDEPAGDEPAGDEPAEDEPAEASSAPHTEEEPGKTSGRDSTEALQSSREQIFLDCPLCDKELSTKRELKAHLEFHEKNDPFHLFSGDSRGDGFTEKQKLRSHMETHNIDGISVFSKSKLSRASLFKSHMNPVHRCTFCNKTFDSRRKLKAHAEVHAGVTPFSCSPGPQKSSGESGEKKHKGEDKVELRCEVCGKRCSSKMALFYHKRVHAQKQNAFRKRFHCAVCKVGFHKRLSYDWHVKMHCPHPGVQSQHPQGGHAKKYNRKLAFRCTVCKSGFRKKELYEEHVKTHRETNQNDLENRPE